MIRRNPSLPDPVALRFGAATLFLLACAPVSEAPPPGTNGGSPSTSGGSSGNGGSTSPQGGGFQTFGGSVAMGGTSTGSGGAATAGSTAKGGTTSNGGTATAMGGAATSGGATATMGGATTTMGGATASGGAVATCGYTGAVKADSLIFKDGNGTSTKGTWKGYAYTYTYGTAKIDPLTSTTATGCFKGAVLCANGSVPADDKSGAGLGWNIAQTGGGTAATTTITGSVVIQMKGAAEGMRVALDDFCYPLTAADATKANGADGLTLKAGDFKTECYGTTGKAYAADPVKAIQVSVPGSTAGTAKTFDFCLIDVEPG